MANFGAEVIKIESDKNPDVIRLLASGWLAPEQHGMRVWGETSPYLNDFLTGKLSVGLDLKQPDAMEVLARLMAQCDVFLSNYSAPAVASLGLDYEAVKAMKAMKSDIIYAVLPGFGAETDVPYHEFIAWGPNQAPLVGLDELTGYEDHPPAGIATISYPDYSNGLHALFGVLDALDERDETGESQYLALSQFEATSSLIGPYLLEHSLTGRCASRSGNRLDWSAPVGVYPCRGDDRWVAISVASDDEWAALCDVVGRDDWAGDQELAQLAGRVERHDEIDAGISAWASLHSPDEVSPWLQNVGVPAGAVLDAAGLATDRQLQDRDFWLWADSLRFGKDLGTGIPIRMSETPGHIERLAPAVGEHNEYVLGELCGCSPDDVAALVESGAAIAVDQPEVRLRRPYLDWASLVMPQIDWSKAADG